MALVEGVLENNRVVRNEAIDSRLEMGAEGLALGMQVLLKKLDNLFSGQVVRRDSQHL